MPVNLSTGGPRTQPPAATAGSEVIFTASGPSGGGGDRGGEEGQAWREGDGEARGRWRSTLEDGITLEARSTADLM
jgi:hypothetical protein